MNSLAKANVNIRLIAQGSSERQVAVVVNAEDASRSLRAAHMAFTLSETAVSVAVLGATGSLGSALLQQLQEQKHMLAETLGMDMRITAAANSKKMMCYDAQGIDVDRLPKILADDGSEDLDLDVITDAMNADVNPHRVIVDCTNSDLLAAYYERWLSNGIHVISPGRKVGAGPRDRYAAVKEAQQQTGATWQYESSVGSGLPILTTVQDLQQTGDKVNVIKGCLSGTMAHVFHEMGEDVSFSQAVNQSVDLEYAENDFREDLSGLDSARKVVILARHMGMDVDVEDVQIDSLIPQSILQKSYPGSQSQVRAALLEDIRTLDEPMMERVLRARAEGREMRYKFVIDANSGKCSVGLEAV